MTILVKCSYNNTISYNSVALSTLSFSLCDFLHVSYFIRNLAQVLLLEVSYLLFSIVNENKRTKESTVIYPKFY